MASRRRDLLAFSANLRDLADGGLVAGLEKSLTPLSERTRAKAQELARERMVMRTWKLHDSIDAEVRDDFADFGIVLWAGDEDLRYPRFQEDGTRWMRGKHYLRDAADWAGRRFADLVVEGVEEGLRHGR